MNNAPIGIFDSGSGGLSVMRSLQTLLPRESFVYIGDHRNNPYGTKEKSFIQKRTFACIDFLRSKQVKLIVIACNTSTVAGIDEYRRRYPELPIVGVVPVIKTAAKTTKIKRFVILSTEFTAGSEYQNTLIQTFARDCEAINLGSSQLVPLIEQGVVEGSVIDKELAHIFHGIQDTPFDVVVLGCTHYPFIRDAIQKQVGSATILDSSDAVARQVARILTARHECSDKEGKEEYFTTGDGKAVRTVFCALLHKNIEVTHVGI